MYQNQLLANYFLPITMAFIIMEALVAAARKQKVHSLKDTLCNFGILIGGRLSQPLFAAYIYFTLSALEKLIPYHWPDSPLTTLAAVFATDFVYYWQHRFSHTTRWLWFFHEVHHSSKYFNLATSFRLHWLGRLIAPIFFGPLLLLGFRAEQVTLFFILNLFYQFFLHTQMIGKLPLVEGVFNTPSAHRVHHARNKGYLNKNFGGILMCWDRLFGTYASEVEPAKFGIIGKFESNNPFTVQFHKIKLYRAFASMLTAFIAGASTAAVAKPALEGSVTMQDSSPLLGTWNAEIKKFHRHPRVIISEVAEDATIRGSYCGLLGTFPLVGKISEQDNSIEITVDFSSAKLKPFRKLGTKSLIAHMQGSFKDGKIIGTATMPDVSMMEVAWTAEKAR